LLVFVFRFRLRAFVRSFSFYGVPVPFWGAASPVSRSVPVPLWSAALFTGLAPLMYCSFIFFNIVIELRLAAAEQQV
jgi:hypothetical protein